MADETKGYRDLIVWQKAMELVPEVYRVVKKLPKEELYALSDQIRRAAVSVAANIAEGQARLHRKEFIQLLSVSRGSLAELDTLLLLGQRLEYLTHEDLKQISPLILEVRRLLQALIRSLQS